MIAHNNKPGTDYLFEPFIPGLTFGFCRFVNEDVLRGIFQILLRICFRKPVGTSHRQTLRLAFLP